jgi:RHS repeat-associated protein
LPIWTFPWPTTTNSASTELPSRTAAADLVGAPAELISPDGDLAGYQERTLWGATMWHPEGASTPLRFPGQYADDETGLHYNQHRYYDPVTGRYLTPDPLGLTPAPNPHAYVVNPCTVADPLGLSPYDPVRIKAGQQLPGAYKLSPAEQGFVKDLLKEKPNYQIFRTSGQASQGDFLVIDRSNPGARVGWVVELKAETGAFPGTQFMNAASLETQFRLSQLRMIAGSPQDVLKALNVGRGSW